MYGMNLIVHSQISTAATLKFGNGKAFPSHTTDVITSPRVDCSSYIIVNTLRPRKNGRHVPDDIFRCIFLNENIWISLKIPLKFVPRGPINNIPALVQMMAWRRPGDKPLSEPMLVFVPTHICVTRPEWVNGLFFGANGQNRTWYWQD